MTFPISISSLPTQEAGTVAFRIEDDPSQYKGIISDRRPINDTDSGFISGQIRINAGGANLKSGESIFVCILPDKKRGVGSTLMHYGTIFQKAKEMAKQEIA